MKGAICPPRNATPGISLPRGTRGQVFRTLARASVGLSQSDIARGLFPRAPQPYRTAAERRAEMAAREAHFVIGRRKVGRALAWLRAAGLAESERRYQLDPSTREEMEERGIACLADRVYVEVGGEIVSVDAEGIPEHSHRAQIARALAAAPDGLIGRELHGPGGPSGARVRALRALVDAGDVLPSGRWVLTEAGRDLAVGGAA